MLLRIDAVLLDLGNVLVFHDNALLVDRLAERTHAAPEPLAEALKGPLADLINRGTLGPEAMRIEICRLLHCDIPMPEFKELWNCHFTPHEAVFARVEELAKRVKLVLVSNTNLLHWEWLRPRLPVLELFRSHVLSFEVGAVKPESAIYFEALRRAEVRPEHSAFFDDVSAYADAARELGIHGRVFTDAASFDRQLGALGLL